MPSANAAAHESVATFLDKLGGLADLGNTLYALYRLAETQPHCFDSYRQLAMSDGGGGSLRLKYVMQAWPGRATAAMLQTGAETLSAELNLYPLAHGAVLCAATLLENLRIVGGLYVTANQRDPATFRRCSDQRLLDHWLNAVCESQVEFIEVSDALAAGGSTGCAEPSRDAPSRAAPA